MNIQSIKDCTGCSACTVTCTKRHAIYMSQDQWGFYHPKVKDSLCNDCGKCFKRCHLNRESEPAKLIIRQSPVPQPQPFEPYYLAQSLKGDLPLRYGCSTSGAAYKITREFIKRGGLACGCIFDYKERKARHILTSDLEEVKLFCGSKYVQSDKGSVFASIKQHLNQGTKVLFTGTPCEVAGLKSILTAGELENLYAIDLVCHGVPSPLVLDLYLDEVQKTVGDIKKINFRFRHRRVWDNHYAFLIEGTKGRSLKSIDADHYLLSFLHNLSISPACTRCHYANIKRQGDLTLGDFWGIQKLIPNFLRPQVGVSEVLVNSSKGEELLKFIGYNRLYSCKVPQNMILATNQTLSKPSTANDFSEIFFDEILNTKSVSLAWKRCQSYATLSTKS